MPVCCHKLRTGAPACLRVCVVELAYLSTITVFLSLVPFLPFLGVVCFGVHATYLGIDVPFRFTEELSKSEAEMEAFKEKTISLEGKLCAYNRPSVLSAVVCYTVNQSNKEQPRCLSVKQFIAYIVWFDKPKSGQQDKVFPCTCSERQCFAVL